MNRNRITLVFAGLLGLADLGLFAQVPAAGEKKAAAEPALTKPAVAETTPAKPAEAPQVVPVAQPNTPAAKPADAPVNVSYSSKGLKFETTDGKFSSTMQHRLQFRYAYPFDADPRSLNDMEAEGHSFMVRRARFKLSGHAYKSWLKYNFQYDWSQPILRDFYITVDRFSWLQLRVGRGKVVYNDERVSSSGAQQFVNRSILNDVFTIDRQQGGQLMGRLFDNTPADINYVVGVFAGRGVGERLNDDTNLMYAARLQWNTIGDPIDFSQSDYKFTQRLQLNIAVGAATNKSNCTAFETDSTSCRRLPGSSYPQLAAGAAPGSQAGLFKVDQAVFEVRSVYKGLYFKHEAHVKRVTDQSVTNNAWPREAEMWGGLVQLGYFPHSVLDFIPAELEVAGRYAWLDPNINVSGNNQEEYTGILNWFANGHNNKLSFEITQHVLQNPAGGNVTEQRYRSQWEFSF